MDKIPVSLIVAMDTSTFGIGKEFLIPWKVPEDMKFFKKTTSDNENSVKNILICGRNTFDSIGCGYLPNRHMIVVSPSYYNIPIIDLCIKFKKLSFRTINSKHVKFTENVHHCYDKPSEDLIYVVIVHSINDIAGAILSIQKDVCSNKQDIVVIGGSKIYSEFIRDNVPDLKLTKAIITRLDFKNYSKITDYDVFFDYKSLKNIMKVVKVDRVSVKGNLVEILKRRTFFEKILYRFKLIK